MKTFSEILRNDEALKVKKIKIINTFGKTTIKSQNGATVPVYEPKILLHCSWNSSKDFF